MFYYDHLLQFHQNISSFRSKTLLLHGGNTHIELVIFTFHSLSRLFYETSFLCSYYNHRCIILIRCCFKTPGSWIKNINSANWCEHYIAGIWRSSHFNKQWCCALVFERGNRLKSGAQKKTFLIFPYSVFILLVLKVPTCRCNKNM